MSTSQKVRRAIENKLPLEEIRERYVYAVKFYEKNKRHNTHPIHYAAKQNYAEMIEIVVVEFGCDVNFCAYNGENPLQIAVNNNNFESASKLLELGANVKRCGFSAPDLIPAIIHHDNIRLLKFLIYQQLLRNINFAEISFSYYDMQNLNTKMLMILIALGFDVNHVSKINESYIMILKPYRFDYEIMLVK